MKNTISILVIFLACTCIALGQRSRSALLPADEAKQLAKQCSRASPRDFTDVWTPQPEQIIKMEERLNDISKLISESCCIIGERVKNPNDWYLQYAALVWQGKKVIYISAVSTEKPICRFYDDKKNIMTEESCEDWKVRAEIVCDGGTNWGVIFDPAKMTFSNLAFNGVA